MPIDVEKIIIDALISLSEEIPLSKITVSDIIKRANVGRQTFYNHFSDKFDLINKIYKNQAIAAFSSMDTGLRATISESQRIFIEKRAFFAQACKMTGQNSLREYMYEECVSLYRSYIQEHYGAKALTDEVSFAIDFYSYGVTNMMVRQCIEGLPITQDQKTSYVIDCMPDVLKKYVYI